MATNGASGSGEISAIAAAAAFGSPLITNVHRGLIVEAIVRKALPPEWHWCSADYHPWDFERIDGTKLEVRQSASRQSWHDERTAPSSITFDIDARNGAHQMDGQRVTQRRRWADIYIFAHHPVIDRSADHRDPQQWIFYIVAERNLPHQATLALSRVRQLSPPIGFDCIAINMKNMS